MERIKVIHFWKDLDTYYGVHDQLLTLVRYIDRKEFDLSVCVLGYTRLKLKNEFDKLGVTIHNLKAPSQKSPLNVIRLVKLLRRERPRVFQTYCLYANTIGTIAARFSGVPVLIKTELTQRDQAPTRLRRFRDHLLYPLDALLGHLADAAVYVSNNVREGWVGKGPSPKTTVIYPPFNYAKYAKLETRQNLRPPSDGRFVIGIVARLSEEKRHEDLLFAMPSILEQFPRLQLRIVGSGPLEAALQDLTSRLNITRAVKFAGHSEKVFEELQRMDLFVLPSRSEGVPISIIEAMVMGLPVVATRVGGIPEAVIEGTTGILVTPRQPAQLADAIIDLLTDPAKTNAIGKVGRERALNEFHPEPLTRKHEQLYRMLSQKN